MDQLQRALKAAAALAEAERARVPYQTQINTFMQNPDAQMNEAAQAAFEEWAMCRNDVNKAFRQAGLSYSEKWTASDYQNAALMALKRAEKDF